MMPISQPQFISNSLQPRFESKSKSESEPKSELKSKSESEPKPECLASPISQPPLSAPLGDVMSIERIQEIESMPVAQQVGRFWSVKRIAPKPLQCLINLETWFTEERVQKLLLPLIRQTDPLSLRTLDWLVTNYAKKEPILLIQETGNVPLNIYQDYLSMLKIWKRKNFDPFRRHTRIYFRHQGPGPRLEETTVAQLNFLHWAETRNVLYYARKHLTEIQANMTECTLKNKQRKRETRERGLKVRRTELSKIPKNLCSIFPMETVTRLQLPHIQFGST